MFKKNSHTSALFHYTRKQNILIKILKEGIKFSYCKEKISDELCIGIPMISFCDIPIGNSIEHSLKYGSYAIALSKEKLMNRYKSALGPVNYFTSLSSVVAAFKLKDEAKKIKKELDDISSLSDAKEVKMKIKGKMYKGKTLYGENAQNALQLFINTIDYHHYSTQAIGFMKPYQSIRNNKTQVNYDECEWRIVLPENARINTQERCQWFWSEDSYDKWRQEKQDKFINDLPLLFSVDDIEYIIVPSKNLIPNFIKKLIKLEKLCGTELKEREKYSLVSKVISIEQIKKDF